MYGGDVPRPFPAFGQGLWSDRLTKQFCVIADIYMQQQFSDITVNVARKLFRQVLVYDKNRISMTFQTYNRNRRHSALFHLTRWWVTVGYRIIHSFNV